jgi:mannose-1-phosphate guanylyltransferase
VKVLLLAAGLGTRLRPITNTIPKCLVPIGGKPLLEIWLERLSAAGFGPFLINTHYFPEKVEEFLACLGNKYNVHTVFEPTLLGTAGTLFQNLDFFEGQDGLVAHADNYCLADFQAFREAHERRPCNCDMTMMTFRTDTPESCGIVNLDDLNIVQQFYEKTKNPPGDLANGAIYLLSAEMIKNFKENFSSTAFDFSAEIVPKYLGKIFSFETFAPLIDIGTPSSLARAQTFQSDLER